MRQSWNPSEQDALRAFHAKEKSVIVRACEWRWKIAAGIALFAVIALVMIWRAI
jgi:hypothetical protein